MANILDGTATFKSPRESYNYIELLGGRKIRIEELEDYGEMASTYYLLDNMLLQAYGEYQSIYTTGGYPKGVEVKLDNSPYKDYFYGWNILNLEALVYLHALINSEPDKVDEMYKSELARVRNETLVNVWRKAYDREIDHFDTHDSFEEIDSIKGKIDAIKRLIFPLCLNDIKPEDVERFSKDVIFHTTDYYDKKVKNEETGTEEVLEHCIRFDWETKGKQDLMCHYVEQPDYQTFTVTASKNGSVYRQFIYSNGSNTEQLIYLDDKHNRIYLDMTNGTIEKNFKNVDIKEEDYARFDYMLQTVLGFIMSHVPYLAKYVSNDQERKTK